MLIDTKRFPQSDCRNTLLCRDDNSLFDEYKLKIANFIQKIESTIPTVKAFNKDRIGYDKEAQCLYNISNDFLYFIALLKIMFWENYFNILYGACDENPCDDIEVVNPLVRKYNLPGLLVKLECAGYDYQELKKFVADLGFSFSVKPTVRAGINYMCINNEDIEDFVCSCEDSILIVQ